MNKVCVVGLRTLSQNGKQATELGAPPSGHAKACLFSTSRFRIDTGKQHQALDPETSWSAKLGSCFCAPHTTVVGASSKA